LIGTVTALGVAIGAIYNFRSDMREQFDRIGGWWAAAKRRELKPLSFDHRCNGSRDFDVNFATRGFNIAGRRLYDLSVEDMIDAEDNLLSEDGQIDTLAFENVVK
jgi:hypothetical protein